MEFIISSPKTQNGSRRLPMMSNVEMLLKKQINILQPTQGKNSTNIKLLFPSDKGSYKSQNSMRK